ncbi:hypothetical protein V6N13_055517 [Hibiscus sabdariffa]|uniref:Chitin-binding type-2 domain-containing protein n=1 Tax=Hibiscus sabdariffa TaxID=183260 RepID=A0ABR2NTS0_9ROSI
MSPLPAASLFLSILFFLPRLDKVSAAGRTIPTRVICNNTCGTIPVGTGFGCGHPYFARYIKCNAGSNIFVLLGCSTSHVFDPSEDLCETASGSGYSLDLPKFQCSSYTSIFEFGDEGDPMKWKFGTSLLYNDSYYTPAGKDCETSGGLCGFTGLDWMDHFPAFVGMV